MLCCAVLVLVVVLVVLVVDGLSAGTTKGGELRCETLRVEDGLDGEEVLEQYAMGWREMYHVMYGICFMTGGTNGWLIYRLSGEHGREGGRNG